MIFKINYLIVILLAQLMLLVGCGGGSSSSTISGPVVSSPVLPGANVLPITIDGAVGIVPGQPYYNGLFVSVTVCAHGTSNCQIIDHVLLDSGSMGLRIFSSVLNPAIANVLPSVSVGNVIAECAVFASGYTWGTVKTADVQLGGETAPAVPVHIMADPAVPILAACSNQALSSLNSVQSFGANGVLGVSAIQYDGGAYYNCTNASCVGITVNPVQQVQSPVALLPTVDNNGVIIVLPALPSGAAASVNGSLILGIGTWINNAIGSATSFGLNANGDLQTTYKSALYPNSFVDSGSNGLYFLDPAITPCRSPNQLIYCPTASLALSATIQGATNSNSANINFTVANPSSYPQTYYALDNLAGTSVMAGSFDWGLPFFFGRQVYFAIEGQATPLGTGPYVAF